MFHYSDGDGVFTAQAAPLGASGMEVDRGYLDWNKRYNLLI